VREVVSVRGERGAIFKYAEKSPQGPTCADPERPMGEGKLSTAASRALARLPICARKGAAPAPFTEKVRTSGQSSWSGTGVGRPASGPAGTRVEPTRIGAHEGKKLSELYEAYLHKHAAAIRPPGQGRGAASGLLEIRKGPAVELEKKFAEYFRSFGKPVDFLHDLICKPFRTLSQNRRQRGGF